MDVNYSVTLCGTKEDRIVCSGSLNLSWDIQPVGRIVNIRVSEGTLLKIFFDGAFWRIEVLESGTADIYLEKAKGWALSDQITLTGDIGWLCEKHIDLAKVRP